MRVTAVAAAALFVAVLAIGPAAGQGGDKIAGKALEEWIKEVSDPDPSVRQLAIRTVVNFGPPAAKAVPSLQKALQSTDASVRGDAAAALGMIPLAGDDISKVGASLTGLLQDTQRPVRIQAASSLATLGPPGSSATTLRYLGFMITDTTSWEVRKTAAYALGRLALDTQKGPDKGAMESLTGALKDPCAAVRLESIMALSELGMSPRPAEVQAEIKALTGLQKDRDRTVGVWATVLLIFLDEKQLSASNTQLLINGLADPDLRVRLQTARALGALGRIGPDGKAKLPNILNTVPQLLAGLRAPDTEMILTVLGLLGPLGDDAKPAIPHVVTLTKDKELVIRCAAIRTLGTLGALSKEQVPTLISFLDDSEEQVVVSAIYALASLGETGQVAIPNLKKLAGSKSDAIKQTAEMAVKQLESIKPKK